MRHALRDAGFRNLVERDTVVVILIKAEDIRKVPGDCFAFAVGVGREIHGIGLFGRFLQFGNKLLLSLDDGVFRLEIVFHIHAQARLRQVAHMAHGSDDFIVAAQIFLDRFRLGRRLNDNEFRHGFLSPILYLFKPHSECASGRIMY